MHNIQLTPAHILGFIYIAFAHQTDGQFLPEEQKLIWQKLRNQIKNEMTHLQFTQMMDEMMRIYKLKMNDDNIFDIVTELAEQLTELEWLTHARKLECLKDLKEIGVADKKYIEAEKMWIYAIGKIWQVNRSTINKL
jgi:hypothetical protein